MEIPITKGHIFFIKNSDKCAFCPGCILTTVVLLVVFKQFTYAFILWSFVIPEFICIKFLKEINH